MGAYYSARIKKWMPRLGTVILFFLLIGNIAGSELIPTLYEPLINGNRPATVAFLRSIRNLPEYRFFATQLEGIQNKSFEQEVYADVFARDDLIQKLERTVANYPKSRDALFYLAMLYRDQGNKQKYTEYFERARAIDPLVERYVDYKTYTTYSLQ